MIARTLDRDAKDVEIALALARCARAAYSGNAREEHPDWLDAFDHVARLRHERFCGLFLGNATDAVVAFRGTHEDREWIEGVAYGQMPWVAGRAHGGFVRLLDRVWTTLLAALYDVNAHDRRLWLTGHSLGGALALLAAQRMHHEGFEAHRVVTFGSPAVLDRTAARGIAFPVCRVENNEDIVPGITWPVLTSTYVHAGDRIFLTASGAVAKRHHAPGLARRIDRAHAIGSGNLSAGPFHDHKIDEYIGKLEGVCGAVCPG